MSTTAKPDIITTKPNWLAISLEGPRHLPGLFYLPKFAPPKVGGMWLSLVEHLLREQGVVGSNPAIPTKLFEKAPITRPLDFSKSLTH